MMCPQVKRYEPRGQLMMCPQVKRYEQKMHEDCLRAMDETHASDVKVHTDSIQHACSMLRLVSAQFVALSL